MAFDPGEPYRVEELRAALVRMTDAGRAFLARIPDTAFFAPQGSKWSPAQHVRHLRKSSVPIVTALRLPGWLLRALFGRPRSESRRFPRLRDDYRAVLAAGGRAGRFAPGAEGMPQDPARRREEILSAWAGTNAALAGALARWSESAVEEARLPHPLLGPLSVREMAEFTVYHTVHHLGLVEERLRATDG